MAQTTGPLFSMSAQGTIGNALTFQSWKGRNTTRQRPVPANPKTIAQRQARTWIMILNAIWRQVSDANREGWQSQAEQGQYTKFNAFNSVNLNRRTNGLYPIGSPIWTAPAAQGIIDSSTFGAGTGVITYENNWDLVPLTTDIMFIALSQIGAPEAATPQNAIYAAFLDPAEEPQVTIENLPPGTYYAAMTIRDMNGNESSSDSSAALNVT